MAAFPGDPSDPSYVVDDPISFGGIMLREVEERRKAMAERSRLVAGMVRHGAVYAHIGRSCLSHAFLVADAIPRRWREWGGAMLLAERSEHRLDAEAVPDRVRCAGGPGA